MNEVDPSREFAAAVWQPIDFPMNVEPGVLGRLAASHPLISYVTETGDGSARTIADFWTTEQFHDSALYREFYSPLGVEHQVSITLPAVLPRVIGLAISRCDLDDPFDEHDRAILNVVRPHFAQAYQQLIDADRVRAMVDAAGTVLQLEGVWVILLDHDEPVDVSPGASVLLYRYFGRPSASSALPARVERWLNAQRAAVSFDSREPRLELVRPMTAERDGRQLVMRFVPGTRNESLVLVESKDHDAATGGLQSLGLSEREEAVMRLVAQGLTNVKIAMKLGIAEATVKKHLENSYRKLGVGSRGEAVALAFDLLGHERARPPLR